MFTTLLRDISTLPSWFPIYFYCLDYLEKFKITRVACVLFYLMVLLSPPPASDIQHHFLLHQLLLHWPPVRSFPASDPFLMLFFVPGRLFPLKSTCLALAHFC